MLSRITHIIHKQGMSGEEFVEAYNTVAKDYDEDVKESDYYAPRKTAEVIADIFVNQRETIEILDMACGTGLVGSELQTFGFCCIDGYDPSEGMIEEARQKNTYRDLICQGMSEKPFDVSDGKYDAISICGWHGSCLPLCQGFPDLIRIVKTGGHIVIVIRNSNYLLTEYQEYFKTLFEKLERDGRIRIMSTEIFPGYHPDIEGVVLHFQKNI